MTARRGAARNRSKENAMMLTLLELAARVMLAVIVVAGLLIFALLW